MRIRMYSTAWCSDCWRAKRFLHEHRVDFEEVDIDADREARQTVIRHNDGKRRVPTFEIDGAYYGNPTIPELARIVGVPI